MGDRIGLILTLAWRLRNNRSSNQSQLISFVSFFSLTSIALSMIILLVGLSMMNGFEYEFRNRILSLVPHGEVFFTESSAADWSAAQHKIAQLPGVVGVSPYIAFSGILSHQGKNQLIHLKGVDPQQEPTVTIVSHYLQSNGWPQFQAGKQQIILGHKVAKRLQVQVGDQVKLLLGEGLSTQNKIMPSKSLSLRVADIFKADSMLDHDIALIPLLDAQHYLNKADEITALAIKTTDADMAEETTYNAAIIVQEITSGAVKYSYWQKQYALFYQEIATMRTLLYLSMGLAMIIASFNIIATLMMTLKEKQKMIAILLTQGMLPRTIYMIFLLYGGVTGMIGALFGLIISLVIVLNISAIAQVIEGWIGQAIVTHDTFLIDFIPVQWSWHDAIGNFAMMLLIAIFASGYPAYYASRISPAVTLRSGD